MKPKGKVEVIAFKPGVPNPTVARATLICKDEDGTLWQFAGCYMASELHPYCETQTLELYDWIKEVRNSMGWYRADRLTHELAEKMYREGISPEAAASKLTER